MLSKFKKLLTLLGLAGAGTLVATPALAGPAVIIPALVGGAVAVGVVATGVTLFGLGVLGTAILAGVAAAAITSVGMGMMASAFDVPDYSGNTATGASQVNAGILVNKMGTNNAIPVVYGKRKIGGSRVYISTDGTNNEHLYIVMVFCEGEINAFRELHFDDKLVASGTSITTEISNAVYRKESRLRYELQRGADNQTPPSWFVSDAPGWTNQHRLQGLAVGYFKCRWIRPDIEAPAADQQETADANPFTQIPKINVVVEGKKTPDATSFNDGETTTYANMSKVYTTNPASHILDYLMNDRYGRGLVNDRIGFGSFKTAANKYNTNVTYAGGTQGKIMEGNSVIQTDRTMLENVQTFLQNMRAGMPYVQGKFRLKPLDTGHPSDPQNLTPTITFAVTEKEIVGGITVEGKGHRDHYNQVKAVFPSPDKNWETDEVVYPEKGSATEATFLAEDNNNVLTKELSLEQITNKHIAADVASIVVKKSRNKKSIQFTATAELHEAQVGDIITVTYAPLGFSAAQYRIVAHQLTADYTVQISAIEHNENDYSFQNVDVFIPGVTPISSDDVYEGAGEGILVEYPDPVDGPGAPHFPGGNIFTNAVVDSVTGYQHQSGIFRCFANISHATDLSQYRYAFMEVYGFNNITAENESAEFNKQMPGIIGGRAHILKNGSTGRMNDKKINLFIDPSKYPYKKFRVRCNYMTYSGTIVKGPATTFNAPTTGVPRGPGATAPVIGGYP